MRNLLPSTLLQIEIDFCPPRTLVLLKFFGALFGLCVCMCVCVHEFNLPPAFLLHGSLLADKKHITAKQFYLPTLRIHNHLPQEAGKGSPPEALFSPSTESGCKCSALLSYDLQFCNSGVTEGQGKNGPCAGEVPAASTQHSGCPGSGAKNGRRGSLCPYLTRRLRVERSPMLRLWTLGLVNKLTACYGSLAKRLHSNSNEAADMSQEGRITSGWGVRLLSWEWRFPEGAAAAPLPLQHLPGPRAKQLARAPPREAKGPSSCRKPTGTLDSAKRALKRH